MNRNYKVIWNASLGCFMAVAEYAKSRGKSSSSAVTSGSSVSATTDKGGMRLLRLSALCAGLAAAGLGMQVNAASNYVGDSGNNVTTTFGTLDVRGGVTNNTQLTDNNIGVVGTDNNAGNRLTIKLAKELNGLTSADFGGVNISTTGINASGTQITQLQSAGDITDSANALNAVNAFDLTTALSAQKIKYVSINSTGGTNENNNGATGADSIAIGKDASTSALASRAVAMGTGAFATGSESTALGSASQAFASSATAVGFGARADQYGATATGTSSRAQGQYSSAFGQQASAIGDRSVAIGKDASTSALASSAVAMGDGASATNKSATALGVNAQALGERSVALGEGAKATTLTGTAIGSRTLASAVQSTAVGVGSKATKQWATAMGFVSEANGVSSVALGDRSVVDGKESIAIGKGNLVEGINSIAVGTGNQVSGDNSGAFGDPNIITGSGSYAFGNNNTINNDNAFVVGNSVNTTQDNSIVLGNLSTDRAATTETGVSINGTSYDYAGQGSATNGVLSVGFVDGERQIINLAAGSVSATSTDAINGSQLFATNQEVTAVNNRAIELGNTTAAALGGGASYSLTTGEISSPVYKVRNNPDQSTVEGAINALNQGFKLNSNGANQTTIQTSEIVDIGTAAGETNILVVKNPNTSLNMIDFSLNKDLDLGTNGSVTIGNTRVNDNGIRITGSSTGKNISLTDTGLFNGGNTITGVAAGLLDRTSNQAVNGGQLFKVADSLTESLGGGASIRTNGTISAPVYQVNGSNQTGVEAAITALDAGFVLKTNGADDSTIKAGDTVDIGTVNNETNILVAKSGNMIDFSLNKDLDLGTNGSVTIGNTRVNDNGIRITGSSTGKNISLTDTGLFNGGNTITGVAAGLLDRTSNQAVNGGQLFKVADSLTESLGGGASIRTNGTISAPVYQVNGSNQTGVEAAITALDAGFVLKTNGADDSTIKAGDTVDIGTVNNETNILVAKSGNMIDFSLNKDLDLTPVGSVTTGNTTVNNAGITVTGGANNDVRLTKNGLFNGGNKLKGVADGDLASNSNQAVNGSQLFATNNLITNLTNGVTGIVREDNGNGALSVGTNADATGKNAIAMGVGAIASGKSSISIGTGNEVSGNNSGAIGDPTIITGSNSYSLGNDNTISGNRSFTIGNDNTISGNRSFALGNNNTISSNRSFALGNNITIGTGLNGAVGIGDNTTVTASTDASFVPTGSTVVGTATGSNVVSIGSVGSERRLTNVAAGGADTDAVNVSQLRAVDDKVNEGFFINANNGTTDNVKLSETINFTNTDGNLVATVSDNGINYDLDDNIKVNSIVIGDPTGDNTVLTTDTRGLSVNQSKIVDLLAGTVSSTSQQAINGSQLFGTATSIKNAIGGGSVVNADGTISAPTFNVRNDAGTTQSTVADAINALNQGFKLQSNGANTTNIQPSETVDIGTATGETNIEVAKSGNVIDFSLNRDIDIDSVTTGNTTLSTTGIKITGANNDVFLTSTGLFNGGNIIRGVASGLQGGTLADATGPTLKNAANIGDLQNSIAGVTDAGLNFVGDDGTVIDRNLGDTLNVTGGATGTLTTGNIGVVANGTDGLLVQLAEDIDLGTNGSVTTGNTELSTTGIKIIGANNDVFLTSTGLFNGGNKIRGVAAGDVAVNSKDAINGGQLFGTAQSVATSLGGNSVVNSDGTISAPSYTLNGVTGAASNVGDALTNIDDRVITNTANIAQGFNISAQGGTADNVQLGGTIDFTNTDNNLVVTNTDNKINYDLANIVNIGTTNPVQINGTAGTISGLTNKTFDPNANYAGGQAATQEQLSGLNTSITSLGFAIEAADGNTVQKNLGQAVEIVGSNSNITTQENGGKIEVVLNNNLDLGNAGSVTMGTSAPFGLGSVTTVDRLGLSTGNVLFNTDVNGFGVFIDGPFGTNANLTNNGLTISNGPSILRSGINAGNTVITNVAPGSISATSQDAVNGSQLFNQGTGVASIIGGNTVYDPTTGTFTNNDIGGTGENNINDAIQAVGTAAAQAKSTVSGSANVTVVKTGATDGPNDYQVVIKDDISLTSVTTGNTVMNNDGVAVDDGDGNSSTMTTAGTTVTNKGGDTSSYGADGMVAGNTTDGESTIVNQDGLSFTNSDGDATGPTITAGGINAGNTVITGVADGEVSDDSTDAINGSQLNAVSETANRGFDITTAATGTGTVSGTTVANVAPGSLQTVTAGNNISISQNGIGLTIATNPDLIADSVTATDDDGNETTLSATGTTITDVDGNTNNSTATSNTLTNGANVTTVTGSGTSVTDGTNTSNYSANGLTLTGGPNETVSLTNSGLNNGGNKVTGVADGIIADGSQDAINGGQLNTFGNIINNSINELGYRIDDVEDDANAGISAAMAMSSIPQSFLPGRSLIGGGVATYNGESAVAVGLSRVSDNGRWVMKINGTADTQGNAGGAIGAGFHF